MLALVGLSIILQNQRCSKICWNFDVKIVLQFGTEKALFVDENGQVATYETNEVLNLWTLVVYVHL